MNCPHCHAPIPDRAVVQAAASINAKRPRTKGISRNAGENARKAAQAMWAKRRAKEGK